MIRRNVHFLSALVVLACVGWTPRGHANWSPDTVLSDASASFLGEEGDAGISVSADGDLDGDGFDDILISAPPYSQVVAGGGKLYVVFGHASGWAMDTPLSQADSSFLSLTPDGNLGSHATIVGDVNGDGFDDFLASEPGCHERAGCAYLVLGKAAGWVLDVTIDNADAWFVGENPYDTVATVGDVGDVDGDGFDDFLVGAEYSSEAGSGAGQVYLFSGGQQGWAPETSLAAADASFLPEHAEDYLSALRGRGDVDGDGFNDLLLGADGADAGENNTGESYLLLGNAGGWSMDSSLATADASFVGQGSPADHSDQSGFSGCLGDVTGDGLADVVVSAFGHENPDGSSGRVYVVPGMARGWQMDQPLGSAAVVLEGEEPEDHFGSHLACLEDVNGDGIGDLLVGAFMNSENGEEAGQTYLYLGGDDLLDTDPQPFASFHGEVPGDRSGADVGGGGDVNGDGFNDFLIASIHNAEGGDPLDGQVYLFFGWNSCTDEDGDGFEDCDGDCHDLDPEVNPGMDEVCDDHFDNDCDGQIDGLDPDCGDSGKPGTDDERRGCRVAARGNVVPAWIAGALLLITLAAVRRRPR